MQSGVLLPTPIARQPSRGLFDQRVRDQTSAVARKDRRHARPQFAGFNVLDDQHRAVTIKREHRVAPSDEYLTAWVGAGVSLRPPPPVEHPRDRLRRGRGHGYRRGIVCGSLAPLFDWPREMATETMARCRQSGTRSIGVSLAGNVPECHRVFSLFSEAGQTRAVFEPSARLTLQLSL